MTGRLDDGNHRTSKGGISHRHQPAEIDIDAPPDYMAQGDTATADESSDAEVLIRIRFRLCKVKLNKARPNMGIIMSESPKMTLGDIFQLSELSLLSYQQVQDLLKARSKLLGLYTPSSPGDRWCCSLRLRYYADTAAEQEIKVHKMNWNDVCTILWNDQTARLEYTLGHIPVSTPKVGLANTASDRGGETRCAIQ